MPSLSLADRLKLRALVAVRRINRRAIDHWSRHTWTPWLTSGDASPDPVTARTRFGQDLPEGLWVPRHLPPEGKLGLGYVLPYYGLAATAFRLHHKFPIDPHVAWDPHAAYEPHFADNGEGWGNTQHDDAFVALRLMGPNPFLLRKQDEHTFVLDLQAPFEGVGHSAIARFSRTDRGLTPAAISIDGQDFEPHHTSFRHAKRLVNALDARYSVFGAHLCTAHLLAAQSFALAACALPRTHALHALFFAHTRGTLEVNNFAYQLLLSPTSYFAQSGFFDRKHATRLFENRVRAFRLDELMPPHDIKVRGIDAIPDHPYVTESLAVWSLFLDHARELIGRVYLNDDDLRQDVHARAFHAALVKYLPHVRDDLAALETREQLATWFAILLYVNVFHEVSGDYSPFALAPEQEQKHVIRWEHLHDEAHTFVSLHDVLLFEQGAYTGLANAAGNAMLDGPIDKRLRAPLALEHLTALSKKLHAHQQAVRARNSTRKRPFLRMQPDQWELSVSF